MNRAYGFVDRVAVKLPKSWRGFGVSSDHSFENGETKMILCLTVIVAGNVVPAADDALIVVVPAASPAVIVKVALLLPAGTVTLAGTEAIPGLALDRVIATPA